MHTWILEGRGVLDRATIGESGCANGAERVVCLVWFLCVCERAAGSVGFARTGRTQWKHLGVGKRVTEKRAAVGEGQVREVGVRVMHRKRVRVVRACGATRVRTHASSWHRSTRLETPTTTAARKCSASAASASGDCARFAQLSSTTSKWKGECTLRLLKGEGVVGRGDDRGHRKADVQTVQSASYVCVVLVCVRTCSGECG